MKCVATLDIRVCKTAACLPLLFVCLILFAPALSKASPGDLAVLGGVTVNIQPPEAVADGARWSVNGGSERASGIHEGSLFPGRYPLQFRNLPAWQEPDAVEVLVIGGKEASVTATYRRLPTFYFRSVPEHHARPGRPVEFLVRSDDPDDPDSPPAGTALQMQVEPAPAGSMTFDPASGHFVYSAAAGDRLPLTVTFATGQGLSATTTITPLTDLVPEDTVIEYDRPLPDSTSRDYILITEKKNTAHSFNDADQETLSVDISGHTLVFQAGHPAHLFEAYNNRNNLESLNLYADRIIIRSPMVLPQTHVTLHARELRFELGGQIDTTPKPRAKKPSGAVVGDGLTRGIDGDPGHPGGSVDVLVEQFHSDPSQPLRFILNGGQGGQAGDGRNGQSELGLPFLSTDWHNLMGRCGIPVCGTTLNSGVIVYSEDRFLTEPAEICGRKITARGENAVPSGKPGNGGDGGTLRSTLDLSAHAQMNGGSAGAKGGEHVGGTLSARKFVYRVTRTIELKGELVTTSSDTDAPKAVGLNAVAPAADRPVGRSGLFALTTTPSVWLHSFATRRVVEFAKDAYLNGRIAEARSVLDDYRQLIQANQPVAASGTELSDLAFLEKVNLDQVLLEVQTLLHRIDSNLDYFGNPAGWVPMLSFEANLLAFENEVEQSIPVLYLAHWLNHATTNLQGFLAASVQAKQDLEDELEKMITAFNEAQTAIPRLHVESQAINVQIVNFRARLAQRLHELEERARANVEERHKISFWKKAMTVLSVAADLVPIGQPTVGRVGSGLALLGSFNPEDPLQSAATVVPKAFELFSEKNITFCFNATNRTVVATNTPAGTNSTGTATNKQDKLNALTECGKFLGSELTELANVFKEVQVDKNELAAELAKLTAADVVFKDLTEKLKELNAQKEKFALQLAAAVQAVATLSSGMTQNLIATHEIEGRLESGLAALDHGALLHIKEMERRAKDRLLQYQYFLAKSFQYRRLKAYSGNLQLTRILDRFQVLVEAGNSHLLSAQEFEHLKFLFVDELREIVSEMFDNFNAPERSLPVSFRLTADELTRLNTDGRLLINLKERGLLGNNRENVRIADLRVRGMTVHPAGGSIGTHALVGVNFEHSGNSRLTSGGKTFLFRHYQTEAVNPIVWNAVHDELSGTLQNSELSVSQQSLIAVLLGLEPSTASSLVFFSRPAAWADILLTKEVQTDNGTDLVIDDLHVEVQYDFYNTSGNQRELAVEVADDLTPRIVVSQQDINGRQDGQGDFIRVFAPFTQVSLMAPATYGALRFDRWIVNGQEAPDSGPLLALSLTANTKVEARFRSPSVNVLAPALSVVPASAGQVGFTFVALAGARYTLEHSPRLNNPLWAPVETRTGTGAALQFFRPANAEAAGFFRLRVEP